MQDVVIEVNNLSKSFRNQTIFHSVSFKLTRGKAYGFIGPNGSGKSILFKIISGLLAPDTGEVTIFGKKVGKEIDFPRNTGIIIESPQFLEEYSGLKNLRYLAAIQNKIDDKKIKEVIQTVGLDPNNRQPVKKYSLGMKQRLAIAQAMMEDPQILILDEPFNGLDKSGVKSIRSLLLSLKKEGVTILMTSHIQEDIQYLCDDVFEFDQQKLEKKEKVV